MKRTSRLSVSERAVRPERAARATRGRFLVAGALAALLLGVVAGALAQRGGAGAPGGGRGGADAAGATGDAGGGRGRGGRAVVPPPASFTATAIPGVVAAGTKIELVKDGFPRTEGSVGAPDGSLLFCNTDSIVKLGLDGAVSTYIEKSNQSNALGYDPKGQLVSVQRARGNEKVGVLVPAGGETLVDTFDGKPFSRLNDLVVGKQGGIYFTDENGVYYLPPGGKVSKRVIADIDNPNGVILSPDEKVLYANDKDGAYLLAFDVAADGTLSNRRNFAKYKSVKIAGSPDPLLAEDNGADGLTVDNDGRVYVATNAGVEVFSARGELLGVLPAVWGGETNSLRKPQNVAFAGADRKTLYMVGAGAAFKVQLQARGVQGRAK